jgi:hypothetical protein
MALRRRLSKESAARLPYRALILRCGKAAACREAAPRVPSTNASRSD